MLDTVLHHLFSTDGLLIGTLLPFFAILVLVIFVHEMGHYLVGRWCGIGAKAFAIGFGPEIVGFTDRNGTRWKFCAIPLGGYVKFIGDVGAASVPDPQALTELPEEERAMAFQAQALWKRALTVLAGPVANFILAIVLLTGFFYAYGKNVADPVAATIRADSPAAAAGIMPGDRFIRVAGTDIVTFADVQHIVTSRSGDPLEFVIERDGSTFEVTLTPVLFEQIDAFGNAVKFGIIGVTADPTVSNLRRVTFSPAAAFHAAIEETGNTISRTLLFLKRFAGGREDKCQLGGPVKIAEMAGKAANEGISWVVSLTAMLSIGIGILNLMPIPPLDGGHLTFYAIEGAIRRPVPEWITNLFYQAGFFVVMGFMLFVFWNDLFGC